MVFCFFSAQYLPTMGGVERYTYNLALRLLAQGHRVLVVTSALPGLPDRETSAEGIEVWRLPVFPLMAGRFPVLRPGRALSALTQSLWAQPIDLCIIQTRMYTSSIYAALAAHRRQIPALVIEHSTGHMPLQSAPVRLAGHLYEHLACRLIRQSGARFFGVSRAVCRWLTHFGVQAQGTLYNSIDPAALEQELAGAPPTDWRERLGLAPGCRLVVFAGRLIPEKGGLLLAQSFADLGLGDAALLLAGSGPEQAQIEALQLPGVFCLGPVPHGALLQLLTQAELYCLPTRYAEGFPTTLLEAAACGCPILCSNTAGSDELLPDDSYGLRLEPLDRASLTKALGRLLGDPAWRDRAAQKARQNLTRQFTWEATAARLLALAEGETLC